MEPPSSTFAMDKTIVNPVLISKVQIESIDRPWKEVIALHHIGVRHPELLNLRSYLSLNLIHLLCSKGLYQHCETSFFCFVQLCVLYIMPYVALHMGVFFHTSEGLYQHCETSFFYFVQLCVPYIIPYIALHTGVFFHTSEGLYQHCETSFFCFVQLCVLYIMPYIALHMGVFFHTSEGLYQHCETSFFCFVQPYIIPYIDLGLFSHTLRTTPGLCCSGSRPPLATYFCLWATRKYRK